MWQMLLQHPFTLSLLPQESHSAELLPKTKYGASSEVEVDRGETGRLRDLGRLRLWHEKAWKGVEVRGDASTSSEITVI